MAKGEEKRYFDKEFKLEAIRLMDECKRSVRDLGKDLGVHPNLLHQWEAQIPSGHGAGIPREGSSEGTG